MEKADVLELTLKHLQELRRQKNSSNSIQNRSSSNTSESIKQYFNSGYKACASEVSRYLESISITPTNTNLSSYHDSKPLNGNGAFGANLMSHLGKHLQVIEMGSSFTPFNNQSKSTTQPLSVMTYCNDISKTMTQIPSATTSYRNPSTYHSSVPTTLSHYSGNPSGRTLSSSSDCGYSSGRDSVSPHSFASTALSPSNVEVECPASPKINVEDIDDEESAIDMTNSIPLNLVQRQSCDSNKHSVASSEGVWRPF